MEYEKEICIEKIFELIRNGDKKGFALLYELHYNKMYGIAFSVCKNQHQSEDIVHNVIYKLWNLDIEKLPEQYELTWLYRVVKNEAISYIREERKDICIDTLYNLGIPDKHIEDTIDMESFLHTIKPLNEYQRIVVSLKILGGYTHKEISILLGKPIGTIQWLYNSSIKKLKILLTSTLSMLIALISATIVQSVLFFQKYLSTPEKPGTAIKLQFDIPLMITTIITVICAVFFILIYRKSDKLPTKLIWKKTK